MGINGYPQNFPPPQTPVVDERGALTAKDGRYLILALWNRSGKGTGLPTVATGLTATGTTQADALGITSDWNEFDAVVGATGCILPPMQTGADCIVWNFGGSTLNVYPALVPASPVQIDALAVNAPYVLASGKMQWFRQVSPTQIRSMQLG